MPGSQVAEYHSGIVTTALFGCKPEGPRIHRNCDLIQFETEVLSETLNQFQQFLGRIDQLETGVEAVRADIRPAPAAQRIEIDIACTFDFPRQLDAELEHTMGQQRNMADQAHALGGYIDYVPNGLTGLAIVNAEVIPQMVPFDYALFFDSLFHNPRASAVGRMADQI